MPNLSVDGVTLSFIDEGHGLPVLLLHGFPLNGRSFRPQIDALSKRYRFIVPDHRGFGQSSGSKGPTTMERLAQDALSLLDALKVPNAVVGGVSMGGYAAMALLREDPSRVKALVLADTRAAADDEAGKAKREERAQAVLRDGMQSLVDTMLPQLLSPGASRAVREEVVDTILANSPEGAANALRGMAMRKSSHDILARFGGSALILVGEKDEVTPVSHSRELAGLIKQSHLTILPGSGHLSNQEAPEAFNVALTQFLSTL